MTDYTAIRATSIRMERSGFLVSGRYCYRTKTAPAPAYRIADNGWLVALNNGDDEY